MQATIDIPDTFAAELTAAGKDPARVALEALRLGGLPYTPMVGVPGQADARLGHRLDVHAFLASRKLMKLVTGDPDADL